MSNASDRSKRMRAMFAGAAPATAGEDKAATPSPSPSSSPEKPRVASGAVKSMRESFSAIEMENEELRRQLIDAETIVELDPLLLSASFVRDRMDIGDDPQFDQLVRSISEHGQQIPILVRRHPQDKSRYQVAYGHRRWKACQKLDRPVKAIVRELTDNDLVIAQGKENSERKDLSFIEQAMFALTLKEQNFDRQTIAAALGRSEEKGLAYISILTGIAASLPADLVEKIGPAPKVGRPKWEKLAQFFPDGKLPGAKSSAINGLLSSSKWRDATSDQRFNLILAALNEKQSTNSELGVKSLKNRSGKTCVTVQFQEKSTRISIDLQQEPQLSDWLVKKLPELISQFEEQTKGENE